jgi:predicted ATPase
MIRTVTGRGYRFVAPVHVVGDGLVGTRSLTASPVDLVGRARELSALGEHLEAARSGSARLVLVTGEAGSGKTSLVDAFRAQLDPEWRIWTGHCLPAAGPAEPYRPVLDALSIAARSDDGVVEALVRYAPAWLVQLPLPLGGEVAEEAARRSLGATQGRIVREFVAVVEALTARRPIALVLEDLHWADEPTVELLDALARLGAGGGLLVIGTLRRAEGRAQRVDDVVHELAVRGLVSELALSPLSEPDVATYVRRRVALDEAPAWLPALLVERTGGNALFLRCLLDSWLRVRLIGAEDGRLIVGDRVELARDVPTDVRRLIGSQLEQLDPDERRLLEAASVAGVRFSAAEVAVGIVRDVGEVDDALALLAAEQRLIRAEGEAVWPDGTRCGAYSFSHELYRDGVYERLSPSRRTGMHGDIGRGLEQAYGAAGERFFPAQLAHHFVQGGDLPRAVRYLQAAAAQSLGRSAHEEAAQQAMEALGLLVAMPSAEGAAAVEIGLRSILAAAQIALHGWAAPEIEASYARARELAEAKNDRERLPPVIYGLATLHEYRGEYERSEALMSEHLDAGTEALVPEALELLACSTFHQGRFGRSLELAEGALAAYDSSLTSEYLARYGESPAVNYHSWASLSLWFLGRETESFAHIDAAFENARAHTYSLTTAQAQAAFLHQFRRDPVEARRWAETTIEVASAHGFPFRVAQATILRGWALGAAGELAEGAREIDRGLGLYRATGAEMDLPYYFGLAAEVAGWQGQVEAALAFLAQARELVPARGFFYEPQLLALEGRLRSEHDLGEAAALLERAASVAEAQGASVLGSEISALLGRCRAGQRVGLGA